MPLSTLNKIYIKKEEKNTPPKKSNKNPRIIGKKLI